MNGRRLTTWMVTISLIFLGSTCFGNTHFAERKDVKQFIQQMVRKHHFDQTALTAIFNEVSIHQTVIKAMKQPLEKKSWDEYQRLFVTQKRIDNGKAFINTHKKTLARAEKQYGIPKTIITAILGVETNYGLTQGQYRVIDSLATFAFAYPTRKRFFKKELESFLLLARELNVAPGSINGSYAGAIGQAQFMPSSYRAYAVDFSGHGKADLRHNSDDAIASVANYFKQHGWKKNGDIASPAKISGLKYHQLSLRAKKAKYSMTTLKHYGVTTDAKTSEKKASLLRFSNKPTPDFWLTYHNFFVITRYNNSKHYALAVYLLANALSDKTT